MRLKNKKTGESYEMTMPIVFNIKTNGGGEHTVSCESITELNEKWEDYEEPKWNWYIDWDGEIKQCDNRVGALLKFETEEEAEKAVEKLKAWKRLKDKGFRFTDYDFTTYNGKGCGQVFFNEVSDNINEIKDDLDLLFGNLDLLVGGEE